MLLGQLPEFTKASYLKSLYLSSTNFTGRIPDSIGNLQYLSRLSLSATNFIGPIPDSIGNLQSLSTLYLSDSGLYGTVPASIDNLTSLNILSLSGNQFTGKIPISLFSRLSLERLDLSDNQFSGYLSELTNGSLTLSFIDLSANNLQGDVPISLFILHQLSELILASNNFTGILNLDIIQKSKNLEYLDLSNNKLSIIEGNNYTKSFYASFRHIKTLSLASCNLKKFPSFLNYQRDIGSLEISNNKINANIPNWLWSNKDLTSIYPIIFLLK